MKRTLGIAAVILATAVMANGAVLSLGTHSIDPAPNQQIQIMISGSGSEIFTGLTVNAQLPAGGPAFTGDIAKEGTILSGSANLPDPPIIWDPQSITSDFAMHFGGPSVTIPQVPAVARILIVDATGLDGTDWQLDLFNGILGDSSLSLQNTGTLPTLALEGGMIHVTPEPAALALLAIGGLFLRRRTA